MIVTTRPWLNNDFDYYIYNLHTDKGHYGFYETFESQTTDFLPKGSWEDNKPDFYFLDLNFGPNGDGNFYYYEELSGLKNVLPKSRKELERETFLEEDSNEENSCECLTDELSWSRNRQNEWYALYRKEYNLGEEHYVDEQDLLDWLGANFTITRTLIQEI